MCTALGGTRADLAGTVLCGLPLLVMMVKMMREQEPWLLGPRQQTVVVSQSCDPESHSQSLRKDLPHYLIWS